MAAPLTNEQIQTVKATVPVLKQHGEAITTIFYQNMLRENEELRNIFSKTSQDTMRQPRALATSVLAYATYIDDLGKLTAAVERIAHKHVSLQVTPAQYDIVGKYLIQAIGQVLGDAATPPIVEAWTAAYSALAALFIGLEGKMYQANAAEGWVGWRKFRIARKVTESSNIASFYLVPSDGRPLPRFKPGQYVSLQLHVPQLGYLQSRQYSMSEAPRGSGDVDHYRISVKRDDGDKPGVPGIISNMLHNDYKEGDEVELSHPQGEFFVDPHDTSKEGVPLVLISVGVGATPLMSILESLSATRNGDGDGDGVSKPSVKRPIAWVHSSRSKDAQLFREAVQQIVRDNDNVSAHIFLRTLTPADQEGVDYTFGEMRLNLDKIDGNRDLHLDDARTEYYICGPEDFMIDVRRVLTGKGVDKSRIHLELFATGDVPDE